MADQQLSANHKFTTKGLLLFSVLLSGVLLISSCTPSNGTLVVDEVATLSVANTPTNQPKPSATPSLSLSLTRTSSTMISTGLTQTAPPPIQPSEVITPTQVFWNEDTFIAYIKYSPGDMVHDNALYIIDTAGRKKINVFDGLSGVRGSYFSWSPHGSWLLFSEYDQEIISESTDDTNIELLPFNLWIVRPNGTDRHLLATVKGELSIKWSLNEEKFFFNCASAQSDLEICVVYPKSGKIVITGNIGQSPQPSPDGKRYAYLKDEKEIYITSESDPTIERVFSTEMGEIPGYSWSKDQQSIITAVVNRFGCGNILDGSTTFFKVNLVSREVQVLRNVKWSVYGWKLSPDQNFLLTSWLLCVGNAYDLGGVIGLTNDLITWELDRWTDYEWAQDSKYLIGIDLFSGQHYLSDPATGKHLGTFGPVFLDSLLNEHERSQFFIQWVPQP
jgi:hypothetical protein